MPVQNLLGATETTASTMLAMLLVVGVRPDVQARVRKEQVHPECFLTCVCYCGVLDQESCIRCIQVQVKAAFLRAADLLVPWSQP